MTKYIVLCRPYPDYHRSLSVGYKDAIQAITPQWSPEQHIRSLQIEQLALLSRTVDSFFFKMAKRVYAVPDDAQFGMTMRDMLVEIELGQVYNFIDEELSKDKLDSWSILKSFRITPSAEDVKRGVFASLWNHRNSAKSWISAVTDLKRVLEKAVRDTVGCFTGEDFESEPPKGCLVLNLVEEMGKRNRIYPLKNSSDYIEFAGRIFGAIAERIRPVWSEDWIVMKWQAMIYHRALAELEVMAGNCLELRYVPPKDENAEHDVKGTLGEAVGILADNFISCYLGLKMVFRDNNRPLLTLPDGVVTDYDLIGLWGNTVNREYYENMVFEVYGHFRMLITHTPDYYIEEMNE